MTTAKRFFTVVYEVPPDWKPGPEIMDNPLMSAVSWSHAIHDRDAFKESTRPALSVEPVQALPDDVDDMTSILCFCRKCLAGKKTKDGWPLTSTMFIACSTCGNKRCPHATDHTLDCTNSNEPGQPGSVY
jgi:hypothetical protein